MNYLRWAVHNKIRSGFNQHIQGIIPPGNSNYFNIVNFTSHYIPVLVTNIDNFIFF